MSILTPEQEAREQIDRMLQASGWTVQTRHQMNRTSALDADVHPLLRDADVELMRRELTRTWELLLTPAGLDDPALRMSKREGVISYDPPP